MSPTYARLREMRPQPWVPKLALQDAWKAYDAARGQLAEKVAVARILRENPGALTADRAADLMPLLTDPDIDPQAISVSGWDHLLKHSSLFKSPDAEVTASRLEENVLALTLLEEDIVARLAAEQALTVLRRWLLLSGRWRAFPRCVAALIAQVRLNGGAWLFEPDESAQLDNGSEIALAYPRSQSADSAEIAYSNPITRVVAAQYEGYPYPQWRRALASVPTTLKAYVHELDPHGEDTIGSPADMLIAGCGTGRQVALRAMRFPHDRITAIDISHASIRYAQERCGAAGITNVRFLVLDLHDVAELRQKFDAIFCTGVLPHLPDPEAGWRILSDALKPGGVMQIMAYSKIARLRVHAWRRAFSHLSGRPIDDDLLREVRRCVMARPAAIVPKTRDFFSLCGVHDLLLHPHEDLFDISRIRRGLNVLDLKLIRLASPKMAGRARYAADNPHDPLFCDLDACEKAEVINPQLFAGMYDFWCRKPVA